MAVVRFLCEETDIVHAANGTIQCTSDLILEAQSTSDITLLTDADMDMLISQTWYVFGIAFIFRFLLFFLSKYR